MLVHVSLLAFWGEVVPTKPLVGTASCYKMLLKNEPTPFTTKCVARAAMPFLISPWRISLLKSLIFSVENFAVEIYDFLCRKFRC